MHPEPDVPGSVTGMGNRQPLLRFVANNSLYLMSALALGVGLYLVVQWSTISATQHISCLMFIAVVAHEWEEQRYPGGFMEIMTSTFGIRSPVPKTALLGVDAYILIVVFVPIFFPTVGWLFMAPMYLGLFEAFIHTVGIKLTHRPRPYTPGMATALILLLPISVVGIVHAVSIDLLAAWEWPVALIYMAAGFAVMQSTLLHSVGLTYSMVLKNLRSRGGASAR
jgi:Protein of unknown function with HXXEE motif